MAKRRFFDRPAGLTVAEIISLTGAESRDVSRHAHLITDVAPVDLAGPSDLTFIESSKYVDALAATRAGTCLMPPRFENRAPDGVIVLRTSEPYRAFVAVHSALYPQSLRPSSLLEASGIVAGATIHPTARLESGVTVDPGAVIGPRAEIGAGTMIGATAVIGPDVAIGRDCAIGAGASIMHALIGDRVVIHPGCRIGQDGFGYITDARQKKIPQTGRVRRSAGRNLGRLSGAAEDAMDAPASHAGAAYGVRSGGGSLHALRRQRTRRPMMTVQTPSAVCRAGKPDPASRPRGARGPDHALAIGLEFDSPAVSVA